MRANPWRLTGSSFAGGKAPAPPKLFRSDDSTTRPVSMRPLMWMTMLPGVGLATPFGSGMTLRLLALLAAWIGSGADTIPSDWLGCGGGVTLCAKVDIAPLEMDTRLTVPNRNNLRIFTPPPLLAQIERTNCLLAYSFREHPHCTCGRTPRSGMTRAGAGILRNELAPDRNIFLLGLGISSRN